MGVVMRAQICEFQLSFIGKGACPKVSFCGGSALRDTCGVDMLQLQNSTVRVWLYSVLVVYIVLSSSCNWCGHFFAAPRTMNAVHHILVSPLPPTMQLIHVAISNETRHYIRQVSIRVLGSSCPRRILPCNFEIYTLWIILQWYFYCGNS